MALKFRLTWKHVYHYINTLLIKPALELFLPALCFICENRLEDDRKIVCHNCFQQLPKYDAVNTDPFPEKKFNTAYILFDYNKSVQILIHLLKYRGYFTLAEYFAAASLLAIPQLTFAYYDYILPVPLYNTRLRERGFNQSTILGKALGKKTHRVVREDILIRQRNTISQTKLNRRQRLQNVCGAFRCNSLVTGAHILLVDDVITTGSTVNACCQTLFEAGAAGIDVFALANPILDGPGVRTDNEERITADSG